MILETCFLVIWIELIDNQTLQIYKKNNKFLIKNKLLLFIIVINIKLYFQHGKRSI